MTEQQILDIYKQHNAYCKGHFLLSSGLHSDTYMQSALVMQYPYIAKQICEEMANKIAHIPFTTIVSPAIGGLNFGYQLAAVLSKKMIFTERVDNIMTLRRGFSIFEGESVVIAEDVVTTGKSTKECMAVVESLGANVVGICSLVDRSPGDVFVQDFYSLLKIESNTYSPDNCPLCANGDEAIKPGSRKF